MDRIQEEIKECEDCLTDLLKFVEFKFVTIRELSLSDDETRSLNNEAIHNARENRFLLNWDKVKRSLLDFTYFPFLVNEADQIIAGRHRFSYLKDNPEFDQETHIPVVFIPYPEYNLMVRIPFPPNKAKYFAFGDATAEGYELQEGECELSEFPGENFFEVHNKSDLTEAYNIICRRYSFYLWKYYALVGKLYPSLELVKYKKSIKQGDIYGKDTKDSAE